MSRDKEFLEMAEEAVSDAEMVKGRSKRLFWNSLYYALFYGAKAALLKIGKEAKIHSGTDRQVGKVLCEEEEMIDADTASFYSDIRSIREEIDYQPDATINRDPDKSMNKVRDTIKTFREIVEERGSSE